MWPNPQYKRSNYNMLEDNIITLKADMIVMKNFIMQKIINITQRIKNVAWKFVEMRWST